MLRDIKTHNFRIQQETRDTTSFESNWLAIPDIGCDIRMGSNHMSGDDVKHVVFDRPFRSTILAFSSIPNVVFWLQEFKHSSTLEVSKGVVYDVNQINNQGFRRIVDCAVTAGRFSLGWMAYEKSSPNIRSGTSKISTAAGYATNEVNFNGSFSHTRTVFCALHSFCMRSRGEEVKVHVHSEHVTPQGMRLVMAASDSCAEDRRDLTATWVAVW